MKKILGCWYHTLWLKDTVRHQYNQYHSILSSPSVKCNLLNETFKCVSNGALALWLSLLCFIKSCVQ